MHHCKGFLIIHMSTFLNNSLFFKNKNILSKKVGKKVEKVEKWIFFQKKWKKSEKWKKVEKVDDLTPWYNELQTLTSAFRLSVMRLMN